MRENSAMHEENFWSNWQRDEIGKEDITAQAENDEEEKGAKRKREEEEEENETETVKRGCDGCVSVEAFNIFRQGRDLESCGDLFWEDFLEKHEDVSDFELDSCAHVLVVLDVFVSLSSVVTECCEVFSCCSDWEDVVLLSFSLSKERAH